MCFRNRIMEAISFSDDFVMLAFAACDDSILLCLTTLIDVRRVWLLPFRVGLASSST